MDAYFAIEHDIQTAQVLSFENFWHRYEDLVWRLPIRQITTEDR